MGTKVKGNVALLGTRRRGLARRNPPLGCRQAADYPLGLLRTLIADRDLSSGSAGSRGDVVLAVEPKINGRATLVCLADKAINGVERAEEIC
jgi:hypothetical protein